MIISRDEACDILRISLQADQDIVRKAYRYWIKIYHPDAGVTANLQKYNQVIEAYEYLCNNPFVPPVKIPERPSKILGGGAAYQSREKAYKEFSNKIQKQQDAKSAQFAADMKAFTERKAMEEKNYKEAMDAINMIRLANAIKTVMNIDKDGPT